MAVSERPWWFDGRDVFHKKPDTNIDQVIIPLGQVISDTFTADGAVSADDVRHAVDCVNVFADDDAIMRGYLAVKRMLTMRVGDRHDHAQAFREAALNSPRESKEKT